MRPCAAIVCWRRPPPRARPPCQALARLCAPARLLPATQPPRFRPLLRRFPYYEHVKFGVMLWLQLPDNKVRPAPCALSRPFPAPALAHAPPPPVPHTLLPTQPLAPAPARRRARA